MTEYAWLAHYDANVPHSLEPYPRRTLLDYFDDGARERPGAPVLLFKGRAVSYAALDRASDAFAAALAALGVRRGDRVGVMLPNCPQFFVAELAAWKLGAALAPLNPIYTDEELVGPLETIDAKVLLVLTPFYERVKRVQGRTPVTRVITTNIKEYFPAALRLMFTLLMERRLGHRVTRTDGDLALDALVAQYDGQRPGSARPAPEETALLLLSGGTTGTPKCVIGDHHALVISGLQLRAWIASALPAWEATFLCPLPLFHSYAACAVQSTALIGHNPLALVPNPRDLADVIKTFQRVKPAAFVGVPTLYNALLARPEVRDGRVDFSKLKACASGAAPLMAETKRRWEEVTGARLIEGYSLTESLIAAAATPLEAPSRVGSVGLPLPDVAMKIVDADDPGRELAPGEVGEILIRARQLMKGYLNNPEETALMLRTNADGETWLHTGDLGYMDADSYLYIVDRKKDLIKPSGMQVWPRELEEAIAKHPAVAEVGVRGFPDAVRGEIAVAFVVLRQGMHATADEIRAFCKEQLAPYKVPGRVVFRRELPKSLIGKVLRRLLTLDEPHAPS
ncbi:MAG: AMP-binding protein [Proteobacteria bacterium]|nr:AMP-binding protein [Pseudomonadota bacterium]